MQLSDQLIARIHRRVEDSGPAPGAVPMRDEDYEALADALLADHARRGPADAPFWVFAYGSLLWKPAFDVTDERPAVAPCWHRTFRLKLNRWRGTVDRPGLMLILDRGGRCKGFVQRLPAEGPRAALEALLRREVSSRTTTNRPRFITVDVDGARTQALAFCADRAGPAYTGPLTPAAMADVLASAVGHIGTGAEYLLRTVEGLERRVIRDRWLWQLQAMVAERIHAATPEARP